MRELKQWLLAIGFCLAQVGYAVPLQQPLSHPASDTIPTNPVLTLSEVVDKTYVRSPSLPVLNARLEEAGALQRQATSPWAADPAIAVRHQNNAVIDNKTTNEWEWGIDLPLWWPGQRAARQVVADRLRDSVTMSQEALRLMIAGFVRDILWEIELRENQRIVAKQEWKTAQKLEQEVSRRVELGDLAYTDKILAQQETLGKEAIYHRAQTEYRHALHRYRVITGLDSRPVQLTENLSQTENPMQQHPLLAEAQAEIDRNQAGRDLAQRQRRGNPVLTLGTRHEKSFGNIEFQNSLGATLRLPFGLSSQSAPAIASAERQLSEAWQRYNQLQRDLQIALEDAIHNMESIQRELPLVEKQNQLSQEHYRLMRRAFELGETDLAMVIRFQNQAFATERLFRQKRLELGLNTARYNQAVGVVP